MHEKIRTTNMEQAEIGMGQEIAKFNKLTIEELKGCEGFETIPELKGEEIIESLYQLAIIAYSQS